jgi:hypothetical protein
LRAPRELAGERLADPPRHEDEPVASIGQERILELGQLLLPTDENRRGNTLEHSTIVASGHRAASEAIV